MKIRTWTKRIFYKNIEPKEQMRALLKVAIRNPAALLANNPCTQVVKLLKTDSASTVGLISQISNDVERSIVVKRTNTRTWFQRIRRAFGISRAERNWFNAAVLTEVGIPTFEPLMMIENCFGFLKGECYLVMSYLAGEDGATFFSRRPTNEQWQGVADKIINIIRELEKKNISHRDLNLSNFVIKEGEPYLIDLDAMRLHDPDKPLPAVVILREHERFLDNIEFLKKCVPEAHTYFHYAFKDER